MIDKAKKNHDEIADRIIRDYGRMADLRSNLDSHCQEIAERIIPGHSRMFTSRGSNATKGEKRSEHVFDSTGAIALDRFAAIVDSLLTPRNQTWQRLMASDPVLNKNREVRRYFEEANRMLFKYRYAPRANFASQNQQNYLSLGAYGTGAVYIDALKGDRGTRYRNIHLAEIYCAENHQGLIDHVVRYFPLTARQAAQQFGLENLPEQIQTQLKVNPDTEFFFIHCVKPREDMDPERRDYRGMPFVSYYVSLTGKKLLDEGGFNTFPYALSRYKQMPGEPYGRSPGMDVLPALKTLNEEKKTLLKQGHRAVDPVLLTYDDGIVNTLSLKPGFVNAGGVTADGRPLVHALPVGNPLIGKELMDDERMVINDAFLVNIFQILTETPTMTATEVLERTREKGILLAPTVGRQQSEYLGPMTERELDVLSHQGLLPPMPEILREAAGEYRIEYDSPLSRAQRAEEAAGLMRTVEIALQVVNITQNPEPLDFFDWDVIMPDISDIQGVPASWRRDINRVMAIREGRAEQQEQQTMIQAAPGAAALMKAATVAKQGK